MRLATACAVLVAAAIAPATALASPLAPEPASSSARIGSAPRVPAGAQSLGALPGSATVQATVTLASRDPQGLADYARDVATPGSAVYHHYLSAVQFAQRFGAAPADVDLARAALAAAGLQPGAPAANRLSIPVRGPAARLGAAFSTGFTRYRLPGGRTGYANRAAPALPTDVTGTIEAVLGLDTLDRRVSAGLTHGRVAPGARPSARAPSAGAVFARAAGAAEPRVSGAAAPCSAATTTARSNSANTADQIAAANGLTGLYSTGVLGDGQTVALYELEPYGAADVAAYQACYGTSAAVTAIPVDGGPTSTDTATDEADLDIEDVIGLAPHAAIAVYEGPNTGSGAYDTLAQIVTDDRAQVVSTSWGLCEGHLGTGEAAAEATLLQEAAAQGQTVLAASGDAGSNDCGNHVPAVDDPASQPYVTGVGGTRLSSPGAAAGQTVWNSSQGAGGGGVSRRWPQPGYQTGIALDQTSITCGSAVTTCREVPDVAADADPRSGYVVHDGGSWQVYGGTSAAAPTWAALIALANASPACSQAVGFANPALYTAAASPGRFTDVVSGSNAFGGTPGYLAAGGFDMASGLGAPIGSSLAAALCGVGDSTVTTTTSTTSSTTPTTATTPTTPATATTATTATTTTTATSPARTATPPIAVPPVPTVTVTRPRPQRGRVRLPVRLSVAAADSAGLALRYAATGLPAGLHIDARRGVISGTPWRAGVWTATISASDSRGAGGAAIVRWTIAGRPSVPSGSLRRDPWGRPVLSVTVVAGARAPAVAGVSVAAPRASLRFAGQASPDAITVTAGGRRIRFRARVRSGSLILALPSPTARRLTITAATPRLVVGARSGSWLALTVTIRDAGGVKTTRSVRIATM